MVSLRSVLVICSVVVALGLAEAEREIKARTKDKGAAEEKRVVDIKNATEDLALDGLFVSEDRDLEKIHSLLHSPELKVLLPTELVRIIEEYASWESFRRPEIFMLWLWQKIDFLGPEVHSIPSIMEDMVQYIWGRARRSARQTASIATLSCDICHATSPCTTKLSNCCRSASLAKG